MEAARAMAQGIENADHDAEVRCLPMADGGEGTARALVDATGGSMHAVPVHDPLRIQTRGRSRPRSAGLSKATSVCSPTARPPWSRQPKPAD